MGNPSGWVMECNSESSLIRMIWKILGKSQLWCLILCVTSTEPKDGCPDRWQRLRLGVSVRVSPEEVSV